MKSGWAGCRLPAGDAGSPLGHRVRSERAGCSRVRCEGGRGFVAGGYAVRCVVDVSRPRLPRPWARTSRSKPIETARETRCVPPRSTLEKAAGREHPQAVAARALLAAQGRDQLTVCPRTYNCRFAINTSTSDRFAASCATQALSQSLRVGNSAASVHSKPQLEQLLHCGTLPFASAAAPRSRPRALSEVRRYGDAGPASRGSSSQGMQSSGS